jgi:CHAT domain-containing protein/tetratricopeptide (TPR) repeat protein
VFLVLCAVPALGAFQASWQELHDELLRLTTQRRYAEALPLALETLRAAEATFGLMHATTAASTYDVADAYQMLGRDTEAETFYRRALTLEEKTLGADHVETLKCLNNLAALYSKQNRYSEAIPLFERSIQLSERSGSAITRGRGVASMFNLAEIYSGQGKLPEAEVLYKKAVATREQYPFQDALPLDFILYRFGLFCNKAQKHGQSEQLLRRALAIREKLYGADSPQTAEILNALGAATGSMQHYQQAEELLRRALRIREQSLGVDRPEVAETLYLLAGNFDLQNRFSDAEPLAGRGLAIREKALGASHELALESLNQLAKLYLDHGRYATAEPLYRRALGIRESMGNTNPMGLASALSNLGTLYGFEKRPVEAAPLCQRAADLIASAKGTNDPEAAHAMICLSSAYMLMGRTLEAETVLKHLIAILQAPGVNEPAGLQNAFNSLAELYRGAGKLGEAESYFRQSLDLLRRVYTERSREYATPLNNLGLLYKDQGRYAEAEPLHRQALAIMEATLGPDHMETSYPLNGLASLYMAEGRYGEAEQMLRRALGIRERTFGVDNPAVGTIVNNLAVVYANQGRINDAEPLQRRALAIDEKTLGPSHPIVAIDLVNLALTWQSLGRTEEVEALFLRALRIVEKVPGRGRPALIHPLQGLASYYSARGDYAKAGPYFDRALDELAQEFEYQFSYMSEKDRLLFLATSSELFSRYFSYCRRFYERQPSLAEKMYDLVLWRKGIIARSVASVRGQIVASGDKQAVSLLEQISSRKSRLAGLKLTESEPKPESVQAAAQLEREIDDLETALVRRSAVFSERRSLTGVKWREVAKALAKDDAAIEFVHFDDHDGNKFTGHSYYVALIITAGAAAPKLVSLGEATVLEGAPFRDYRELVKDPRPPGERSGKQFYASVWRPMEAALGPALRVFVSPDGIFNEVSWTVLPSSGRRLLGERYEIEVLLSTRDLLHASSPSGNRMAVLIGAPDFDAAGGARPITNPAPRDRALAGMGSSLEPLEGTRVELQSIQGILQQRGWKTTVYTGADAQEQNVKALESPRVLHFATHGFFLPDSETTPAGEVRQARVPDEPMLRSGLYLAGANRVLKGAVARPDVDDGVLTAFEASTLNLQGTELVVMSACETGLGVVRNGEGVFGLPRAMQEAGARAMLISLWKVPDRETEELMRLFYEKWLAGASKQKALREAQLEMRARIKARRQDQDVPNLWGGFVMIGR